MAKIRAPKCVTASVDRYLELHRQCKDLEKLMEAERAVVEGYMKENDLSEISGSSEGVIKILVKNYKSYDIKVVRAKCNTEIQNSCITEVVDKKALEALYTLKKVSKEVMDAATIVTQKSEFRVSKYNLSVSRGPLRAVTSSS